MQGPVFRLHDTAERILLARDFTSQIGSVFEDVGDDGSVGGERGAPSVGRLAVQSQFHYLCGALDCSSSHVLKSTG
jgi:hypothetical protein